MKFNLQINQKAIIDNQFNLDVVDAILLDYLFQFTKSEGIISINESGAVFYWFSHDKIVNDLPILKLKKDSIFRRLKALANEGFLIQSSQSKMLGRSFYSLTEKAKLAIFTPSDSNPVVGLKSETPEPTPDVRIKRKASGKKSVAPSEIVPVNNNINDDTSLFPKENKDENIKSKKFTIPSVQEVQNYCNERKNGISAFKFVNFYQSKDWMIGKNKMKDWKSAVHTWETPKNENKNGNTKSTTPTKINGKTRQFTIDEFATPSGDSTE